MAVTRRLELKNPQLIKLWNRSPTSVWATVPQLCLTEKGFSEDDYEIKLVDLSEWTGFSRTTCGRS